MGSKSQKTNASGGGKKFPIYNVDELRARRVRDQGKRVEYFVKWSTFGEEHNSWEPEQHILDPAMIVELARKEQKHPWQWQFYVDKPVDGLAVGWHVFEDDRGVSISQAYQAWLEDQPGVSRRLSFVRTLPGKKQAYQYTLDFETMTQTNETHRDHTCRPLRRV